MSYHGPSAPTLANLAYAATRPSLVILASYLTAIPLLARWTLRRSILPPHRLGAQLPKEQRDASPPRMWIALLALSFASTWFFMFRYFFWSYNNYLSLARLTGVLVDSIPTCTNLSAFPCLIAQTIARLNRVAQWLDNTSLFEEAWLLVVSEPMPWWWSAEICAITVGSWALFVRTESHRLGTPHAWAYMLLGQAVAISAAANLFNVALSLRPAPSGSLMIAHSNRQASLPFGAEHLIEAVEMRRQDSIGEGQDGRQGRAAMQRTPSQKAMPPPPLPSTPSGTRTSRSVYTASVLPLPSQEPSLLSRATLGLLIVSGLVTVFRVPTSLASILVMHSFPLILTIRCPVPHSLGERKVVHGIAKKAREILAPSRVHLALGLAGLALKVQTTIGAWDAIHLDAIGAIQRGVARRAAPHAQGHELAVAPPSPLSLLIALARSFISNPARSSISSDAVCIGLTTLVFILTDSRRITSSFSISSPLPRDRLDRLVNLGKVLAVLTPLMGPSTSFSFYLAFREALLEEAERIDEAVLLRQAGLEGHPSPQLVVKERRNSVVIKRQGRASSGGGGDDAATSPSPSPSPPTSGATARRGSVPRSPRTGRSLGADLGIVDAHDTASLAASAAGVEGEAGPSSSGEAVKGEALGELGGSAEETDGSEHGGASLRSKGRKSSASPRATARRGGRKKA